MPESTAGRSAIRLHFAVAVVLLLATPAAAATHVVTQSGFSFAPADLTIAAGDTVRWEWTGGNHTVSNGTSTSDPQFGVLFDAQLNSSNPSFTFVFADEGIVPYFCVPHLGLNMTGTVTVEAASAAADVPSSAVAALLPNTPNPFNPRTEIVFRLADPGRVSLVVHDLAGRLVRPLASGEQFAAGVHRRAWDGRDGQGRAVAAGTYLAVLVTPDARLARKLTLVK